MQIIYEWLEVAQGLWAILFGVYFAALVILSEIAQLRRQQPDILDVCIGSRGD